MLARMLELRHGRTVSVVSSGDDDLLEVRSSSGELELSLKLTEDGVVLQLEAARISLKSTESIDLESRTINLNASGDVRVRGDRVYIN
jgi:hypothetical protein